MGKEDVYFLNVVYDDLYKFSWPVVVQMSNLKLWLDVSGLGDHFSVECETKSLNEFDVVNGEVEAANYKFCDSDDVKNLVFADDIVKINFDLALEQFLYTYLPNELMSHLENLKLTSLYDIPAFAKRCDVLDHFKKYWLFRFKIVTANYKGEEDENNDKDKLMLINSLINNVELQFSQLKNYEGCIKMQATSAFVKLCKGSVSLLEILLGW
uniref:PlxyGVORF28 protein n=1 Tax=Plutella xylostella granulovirus TaxID=98383 RepID=A0A1B2CSD4_9BBAC|nr:PlxyGVORF28 protein [Plutella xylostella granulovirus]